MKKMEFFETLLSDLDFYFSFILIELNNCFGLS